MPLDLAQISHYYAIMDDEKLLFIAKFEVDALQPEVIPIVISEIEKRGLDPNLLLGIEAQLKDLTPDELYASVHKIKGLKCPSCGTSNQKLVGGIIRKVRSYIFFTQYETKPMIACPTCIEAERKNQLLKNCLLGWWGIPSGLLFRTPQAIISHFRDNSKKEQISETILTEFIRQNIGELKTHWDKEQELVQFIHHQNQA